ncbi:DUF3080 family protein [Vreelandella aquamarina]|uniref:DUF3080 family protein n=1 Tax=Vreelandella aquamarina TaxID=77097 RepID=UPI001CC59212|nr:DUF3080 family protein [Halomonas aquamarina]
MRILSLLTLGASLVLSGCQGDDAEQSWVAYHQQIAKDLSSSPIERAAIDNIGAFPPQRERLIPVEETREGMLNIYALRECQITSLIAARNNQLGRVAPPSQHWLYERELWQRLDTCLNSDIPDGLSSEHRARLEQLTQLKTEQLPAVSWNALMGSEEWERSFSRASSALDIGMLPSIDQPLAAIRYLQQMMDTQFSHRWQQDSSRLENHLKGLHQRPLTAEFLRTLMLATQRLNEASAYLVNHDPQSAVCLSAWESASLDQFEQNAKTWLDAVNRLITSQTIEPPDAISHYRERWLSLENDQAPWPAYQKARAHHEATRSTYPQCADD